MLIHINGSTENNKGLVEKIQKGNPVTLLNKIWFDFLEKAYIDKKIEIYGCQKDKFFKLIKKSTDGISGIYAEFKSGQPNTDQVFDAVYGKGTNSILRVLLYDAATTDEDRDNPGANEIIVESLINGINQYGANIFLVKVRLDAEANVQCETITGPSKIVEPSEAKIPPEEIVRESEFWEVYYWSQWECFFKAHECLSGNIHEHWNYGYKTHGNMISWCAKWNDSGIFYEIKNDDEDLDILQLIWERNFNELQALFPSYKLEYFAKAGIPSKIRIKVNDLPVTALLNSSVLFKKKIAGKLLMELHDLDEFMENAEDRLKNRNSKEAMECGLLAEQC